MKQSSFKAPQEKFNYRDIAVLNNLGHRIKLFRTAYGITQGELEELLGYKVRKRLGRKNRMVISGSMLSYVERNGKRISAVNLYKLSVIFDVSIDTFFQETNPEIIVKDICIPSARDEIYCMIMGLKINHFRGLKRETHEETAIALGIDTELFTRIELGTTSIFANSLYAIARYFQVPVSYFFEKL